MLRLIRTGIQKMPNQSVEPTGGSRFSQPVFVSRRRLPPVAHAWRSVTPDPKVYETRQDDSGAARPL